MLEQILAERLREEPPENCTVVKGSIPIIAFGRFRSAKVASVSLNPSWAEFEPVKDNYRFHTLKTLGVDSYSNITDKHVNQIVDYCERYFERYYTTGIRKIKKNPLYYKSWFNPMEKMMNDIYGVSYLDGSACHLDISQWATNNTWGKLTETQRKAIVGKRDLELLRQQVLNNNYEIILLNGATTSEVFLHQCFNIDNYETVTLQKTTRSKGEKTITKVEGYYIKVNKLLGEILKKPIKIFGWNDYIQKKPTNIEMIKSWVKSTITLP
ncbi:hypothetical protein [Peribacillus frigoritolerans]|uniref:hypothetical protein n=1 Tax=Peribacillus frigoritolerans TaxID=450367 RepID=UPI001F4F998F|nr:hypothetical protein [Peribacillus frigoritolerans]MCK2017956.1 hypothetical protein [Peribacillus frigoritolerans]